MTTQNTYAVNPLGFAYSSTANLAPYSQRTAMLVTGQGTWIDPAFQAARKAGCEVLGYVDPVAMPLSPVAGSAALYANAMPWPLYPRLNTATTLLLDITDGSKWAAAFLEYCDALLKSGMVDGLYIDDLGARPWNPVANWDAWPVIEQNAFTQGAVTLIQKLDAMRRRINPELILVNNNTWDRGDAMGTPGENCVNGVCLEHSPINTYHTAYAGKVFCGFKRRLLVIANSTADAKSWSAIEGVTNVSDQQSYSHVGPPPVACVRLDCSRVP